MTRRHRSPGLPCLPALLLAWAAAATAAPPARVASINLCTDVLLHELAAPGQIAAVSDLATDPLVSYYRHAMAGLPVNHGYAEELMVLGPDLVLASGHSSTPTVQLLERQGITVRVIRSPRRLADLPRLYRDTARLLGRPERGERYARTFARLAASAEPGPGSPVAVIFQANGLTYGAGTLAHDVLRAAGLRNLAAMTGMTGAGYLALEELLYGRPDLVVMGADAHRWPSQGQALLDHPALRDTAAPLRVVLPERFWACPGGYLEQAVVRLRQARAAL